MPGLSEGASVVKLQHRVVYQSCFHAREVFSERHCAWGFWLDHRSINITALLCVCMTRTSQVLSSDPSLLIQACLEKRGVSCHCARSVLDSLFCIIWISSGFTDQVKLKNKTANLYGSCSASLQAGNGGSQEGYGDREGKLSSPASLSNRRPTSPASRLCFNNGSVRLLSWV